MLFIFILGSVFTYISYRKEINNNIEKIKFEIKLISSNFKYFFKKKEDFITKVTYEINKDNVDDILREIYFYNKDEIIYVYFADKNGDIIVTPKIKIPPDFDPRKKDWYIKATKNPEKVIVTNSFADPEKTKIVQTVSKAIKVNNNVIGVLGMDLKKDSIDRIINIANLPRMDRIYIFKKNGEVIYNNKEIKNVRSFIKIVDDNNFHIIKTGLNIYFYNKIIDDIYILYVYNKSDLVKLVIKEIIIIYTIIFLIVLLFLYKINDFLNKKIINPIFEISKSMKNVSVNLRKKEVPVIRDNYDIKEIKEIANSYEIMINNAISSLMNFNLLTEEIRKMYNNLKSVNEAFFEFIKLISLIENEDLSMEEYFNSILKYMISHIREAKYGSISVLVNRKWKYITAIGHDINKLKLLEIFSGPENFHIKEKVNIVTYDEIFKNDNLYLDEKIYEELKEATKKFKYAMTYVVELENMLLMISVETPESKTFSRESIEIFKAQVNLAKIFLDKKFEIEKIQKIYFNFAEKLASVAEGHDDVTGKHIYRVGEISAFLAQKLGLDEKEVEKIKKFAPLHDIGKVYVPYEILNKEGKLTKEEFEIMKKHTIYAKRLLSGDKCFDFALNIALYHHENCDGSGYPYGLKCYEIPLEAAIVKIADIYDALRAKRSYKEAFSHEKCVKIITEGDNRTNPSHFRYDVLEIFKKYNKEIDKIWIEINKSGGVNNEH
ncbi:HD domain-containing phosphohydrolase [Marinitoga aeolica]|uniref:HD domain-containing protein n=1 Tax=Marinitoga aeolica TaxID=2809031 RepID=A0ABY8PTB9_9BACT|nr:HD domain-containing phosphohydrolase [Marinitoga aeolica]WGS65885.1 HD domain-containing protein [Marinitoga aeolica]